MTAVELDALPGGSVVIDHEGDAWQKVDRGPRRGHWLSAQGFGSRTTEHLLAMFGVERIVWTGAAS